MDPQVYFDCLVQTTTEHGFFKGLQFLYKNCQDLKEDQFVKLVDYVHALYGGNLPLCWFEDTIMMGFNNVLTSMEMSFLNLPLRDIHSLMVLARQQKQMDMYQWMTKQLTKEVYNKK